MSTVRTIQKAVKASYKPFWGCGQGGGDGEGGRGRGGGRRTQQTMANRFASESDPLNLLSCSNFQPKTSSVYVMKVYPSSDM